MFSAVFLSANPNGWTIWFQVSIILLLTSEPACLLLPLPGVLLLSSLHIATLLFIHHFLPSFFLKLVLPEFWLCAKGQLYIDDHNWYHLCLCRDFSLPGVADQKKMYIKILNPNRHEFSDKEREYIRSRTKG